MNTKRVVGILCEYDPFHKGHARQFSLIRERMPDAVIVCLMSGCFTQRGMPALFSPAFRTEAALRAGAAIVLELPCACSVRDAENFALGGVHILHSLQCVTHLSFGMENLQIEPLQKAAQVLEFPDEAFHAVLRRSLAAGKPFAAAQADALAASLQDPETAAIVAKPNNILAICYLRALIRLQSPIDPLPVQRNSDYHSQSLASVSYPSASAVRKAYLAGDTAAAAKACGYALDTAEAHRPDVLDTLLLDTVRSMRAEDIKRLPDCSEGLENRLKKAAAQALSREELLTLLKTRRYTRARLNRLLTHALLGLTAETLTAQPMPSYVRLLGFRKNNEPALTLLKQSAIPVLAKASAGDTTDPLFRLDERAYDLWALGAWQPAGLMYRQPIVIV